MQRLQRYSAFPRVRSNSLSTLTVTQPSSSSRPVLTAPPRLPSEGPKQSQHSQLALTQPTTNSPLFPCTNPPISQSFIPAPSTATSPFSAPSTDTHRAAKRPRLQYQLDVGAYGIPKHRSHHTHSSSSYPHSALSVQVGEDAYFVRDNAMGIADGVGGWARSLPQSSHPTPSALFSRRLMHFCSSEIDALSKPSLQPSSDPSTQPSEKQNSLPTTKFSFEHHLKPRPSPPPPHPSEAYSFSELEDSLHSSLEELSEGIDVLNILERAYDRTVKAHVSPSSASTPLTTGSSTALLAVLDHPPPPSTVLPQYPEAPHRNYAAGSIYATPDLPPSAAVSANAPQLHSSTEVLSIPAPLPDSASPSRIPSPNYNHHDTTSDAPEKPYDAVIRIAHLGDCMGMLIRADSIAWRSDEMWWGYNHPLQLGPSTSSSEDHLSLPVKPHTFTLPVRADDILILASDGLSDNLWDEDVLDEVLKFRRQGGWGFVDASPPSSSSSTSTPSNSSSTSSSDTDLNSALSNLTTSSSSTPHLILRRKAFAGMLSEALCSRAKRVSERRPPSSTTLGRRRRSPLSSSTSQPKIGITSIAEEQEPCSASSDPALTSKADLPQRRARSPSVSLITSEITSTSTQTKEQSEKNLKELDEQDQEVPFAQRARLAGKFFRGGKCDDISVIVAVISPSPSPPSSTEEKATSTLSAPGAAAVIE